MQFKSQNMASQKTSYCKNKLNEVGFVLGLGLGLNLILGSIIGLSMAQNDIKISLTTYVYFDS